MLVESMQFCSVGLCETPPKWVALEAAKLHQKITHLEASERYVACLVLASVI